MTLNLKKQNVKKSRNISSINNYNTVQPSISQSNINNTPTVGFCAATESKFPLQNLFLKYKNMKHEKSNISFKNKLLSTLTMPNSSPKNNLSTPSRKNETTAFNSNYKDTS